MALGCAESLRGNEMASKTYERAVRKATRAVRKYEAEYLAKHGKPVNYAEEYAAIAKRHADNLKALKAKQA